MQSKANLRSDLTALRKTRTTSLEESQKFAELTLSLIAPEHSDIAIYHATKIEPPTDLLISMLQKNKNIYLPKVISQDLVWVKNPSGFTKGAFNISEPLGEEKSFSDYPNIKVLVIPALAADKSGFRLGKGGGYYDRLLAAIDSDVLKIALLFDNEVVSEVPHEAHDQKVNYLVTEKRIIKIN